MLSRCRPRAQPIFLVTSTTGSPSQGCVADSRARIKPSKPNSIATALLLIKQLNSNHLWARHTLLTFNKKLSQLVISLNSVRFRSPLFRNSTDDSAGRGFILPRLAFPTTPYPLAPGASYRKFWPQGKDIPQNSQWIRTLSAFPTTPRATWGIKRRHEN